MFEQLVRPFQSRQVTTTRRIVPAIRAADETPAEARITWGSVGQLPPSVAQPKATNLENIEAVGFNVRGNIDNFNQTSRESEQVDVPIRDNGGNQIGTATIDRAKSITFQAKDIDDEDFSDVRFFYLPNYTGTGTAPPTGTNFQNPVTMINTSTPPEGLRSSVPSANTGTRTDHYSY